MGNAKIREAMNLMFATILQKWGGSAVDPTGILLLCLVSVVWNVEFLKSTAATIPGHPFGMVPLLSKNAGLLTELKLLVTIESGGQMTVATGIPPHICQAVLIKENLDVCKDTFKDVKEMATEVKNAVKQGFEEKAEECGQMTGERMQTMIEDYHSKVETLINTKLTELTKSFPLHHNGNEARIENDGDDGIVFAEGEEEAIVVNN